MTQPRISVIVVSLERPKALCRCIAGIAQLDYPDFEVIVVADATGRDALGRAGWLPRLKVRPFDTPNISAARNAGLAVAAGDIVAFIDDDAVPEPTWLYHLAGPFADETVASAGGYVRGRNGISLQHRGNAVDRFGQQTPLDLTDNRPAVFEGSRDCAIKTEGTNSAFRRIVLADIGGFDSAFRFYHDETDVNLRLAASGAKTAIVPLAQVHHGFAGSRQRTENRLPRSLHDIGASTAILLRKHAPEADQHRVLSALRAEQNRRLVRHMVAGTCEPRDVGRLMATLDDGWQEGLARGIETPRPMGSTAEEFRKFVPPTPFVGHSVMAGRFWQRRRLRADAAAQVRAGHRVTLFLLSPTTMYHRACFTDGGFWEQKGGLFGRSVRAAPVVQPFTFRARIAAETKRLKNLRQLGEFDISLL